MGDLDLTGFFLTCEVFFGMRRCNNEMMYQCTDVKMYQLAKTRPTRFFFNLVGLFGDEKMYQWEDVPICSSVKSNFFFCMMLCFNDRQIIRCRFAFEVQFINACVSEDLF